MHAPPPHAPHQADTPDTLDTQAAAERLVRFYQALTPQALSELARFYTPDATFKDPFNEVRGLAEIHAIFSHMYASLTQPRFVVSDCIVQGEQCFLVWDFQFQFKRFDTSTPQTIRGGSHLKFASDGRVAFHRDYWDAAEELYEKLPWLGGLMRWLKKKARS